jgi:hypothetical protein
MADPRLIRVVHYPDMPHYLGVVVREEEDFFVYWHTGDCDGVTECGRLRYDHEQRCPLTEPLPPRLPTVTRRRAEVRRAYTWCLTAFQREVSDG